MLRSERGARERLPLLLRTSAWLPGPRPSRGVRKIDALGARALDAALQTRDLARRAEAWARERYRGSEAYLDS